MTNRIEEVRGRQVIIRFDGQKCVHSRNCVLARPDVFEPGVAGQWIHPDAALPEEAVALAVNCPSGAITCERLDGGQDERPPVVNVVRVRENGPLALHAPLSIADQDAGLRATLCRCGASQHKPYCDGSHTVIGFTASGEAPTQAFEPLAVRNGPLTVTPQTDGPLRVQGPLEVVTGTGRTVLCTSEAYLCRCGGSGHKPFCDGTHKKIGFKSG